MASIGEKISQLPSAPGAAQLTDLFPATQAGTTYKFTQQLLLNLFSLSLAPISGVTFTGSVFVPAFTPVAGAAGPNQVVPYAKVQQQASYNGGKAFVTAASTDDLGGTYYNGINDDGVGATLTNNGALVPLELDGILMGNGDRVLLKDQSGDLFISNGIYDVTNKGSTTVPWVLTRSSDFDNSADGQIGTGSMGFIFLGVTQAANMWSLVSVPPLILGTNGIVIELVASGGSPIPPESNSGFATLINGTVDVIYPPMDDRSIVQATVQIPNGTQGFLSTPTTAGIGFTINSTSSSENSVIGWTVLETAPGAVLFGSVTLVAGSATIANNFVTNTSVIILTIHNPIRSLGRIVVDSITAGVGFTISAGNLADISIIDWAIYDSGSIEGNSTVTLSAGAATVSLPSIAANDVILLTIQSSSSSTGYICCNNIIVGTGFSIISTYDADTSVVGWVHYPAASTSPHDNVSLGSGTATVTDLNILNTSVVLLTGQQSSGLSLGSFSVGNIIPASSFVINSNNGEDTSIVGYVILNL